MNRQEEYWDMMEQLDRVPASDPVGKAIHRRKKRRVIVRGLASVALVLVLFVGSINVSPSVAMACKNIPFLAELTELLTFNPSLQAAVENDFVQLIGQEQTKGGITARIEYLIVDQKQVNVYYRLLTDQYQALGDTPEVLREDGSHWPVAFSYGGILEEDDDLRDISIDFIEENVPDSLQLQLKVYDLGSHMEVAIPQENPEEMQEEEPVILEEFVFPLTFDPYYTTQGRTVSLQKTVKIGEQQLTLTDMEIYPTHLRINVEEAEENTAWITGLQFELELEDGRRVEKIRNGITATGSADSPSMASYRTESSFFEDAEYIRMIITGADLLQKDRHTIHVNLRTGEHDPLPEGVTLLRTMPGEGEWKISFCIRERDLAHSQFLNSTYTDAQGEEHYIERYSSTIQEESDATIETYYLQDFNGDEAWFGVYYTDFWKPEVPAIVELQ